MPHVDLSKYKIRSKKNRLYNVANGVFTPHGEDYHRETGEIAQLYRDNGLTDSGIPWWAVALLPLEPGSEEYKCRRVHQQGRITPATGASPNATKFGAGIDYAELWRSIVQLSIDEYGDLTPFEAVKNDVDKCRYAALSCPRAFVQFIGLLDDDLEPWVLKSFHVQAIRAMRTKGLACVLLPFSHGKSALSSIVVPLMDWAENPESTQIRIYHSGSHTKYWTRKLMAEVEGNVHLHNLFPWIDRPRRGDPCEGIWSTEGFSIKGKVVVDPSFRPLTAGSSIVGVRADRVGADDWVNEFNSSSVTVQDKFYNYFKTGVLTMRRKRVDWSSRFATLWGNAYLIGTLFDRRDVNYRIHDEWTKLNEKGDKSYYTMRKSIYPHRNSRDTGEVIWPEKRPPDYVKQLEIDLGRRAFRMRCENRTTDTDETVFTERMLEDAKRDDLAYGELPSTGEYRFLLAYDPGTGQKSSRFQKYPAAVLMGQDITTQELHFIRFERWPIPAPRQIDRLIDWGRRYAVTICVESNATQASYQDWIRERAPDVRVITHYTSNVKHDAGAGVESLLPLFEAGKVRIHTGGVDEVVLREFVQEFIEWPQGRYSDMLMAAWIGRYKLRELLRSVAIGQRSVTPMYVRERGIRQRISLAKYK